MIFSGVCFGTNDLERAGAFYDTVLSTIGVVRLDSNDNEIGYGPAGGSPSFWAIRPYNREPATSGNGTQVIINAPDRVTVDRFHQTAIDAGGQNEGSPGLRDHTPGYYGAYVRDLDGNKLHIVAMIEA